MRTGGGTHIGGGSEGQGALEYLIIVAAVLAIAAIVVLFLTGAFSGTRGGADVSACKAAASQCAVDLETAVNPACSYCDEKCEGDGIVSTHDTYTDPVDACKQGLANYIAGA